MQHPEGELVQFVQAGLVESVCRPIHIEAVQHRPSECQSSIRHDRNRLATALALTEHEFNLIVRFQLFDGERESFGHSQDWVGGTFELSGEMIQEPVGRPPRALRSAT